MDYVAVCRLAAPPSDVVAVPLSKQEHASLAGCRTAKRRREVDVSRRLVRYGLRAFLRTADDDLEWRDTGPRYSGGKQAVRMSVAHSRGHVAAAWSATGAIGVDVESLAARPRWRRIMESMFCDADTAWITRDGPPSETTGLRRFLAVWTAREAYAKYLGGSVLEHLSQPLLRDAADQTGGAPYAGACVEVDADEHRVVAVCRPWRNPMPVCLARDFESADTVAPRPAEFVFLAGAPH